MRKIAIVTGASSGLGREFVQRLDAQEDLAEMWVIARRAERLEALRADTRTPLRVLAWDLTREQSLLDLTALLERETPRVEVLIHAAGFGKIGSYRDIPLKDCEHMIDLNCRAAVSVTQRVLPYMEKGSRILEICSTAAFQPFQYLNVYAASKAFLYRYSRALRVELLGTGIHVTAVCPYWIKDTEFIGAARETRNSAYIRHFPLASRRSRVVRRALRDSRLNLPVSTPGPVCGIHRLAAKLIPNSLMMGIWGLLRRL